MVRAVEAATSGYYPRAGVRGILEGLVGPSQEEEDSGTGEDLDESLEYTPVETQAPQWPYELPEGLRRPGMTVRRLEGLREEARRCQTGPGSLRYRESQQWQPVWQGITMEEVRGWLARGDREVMPIREARSVQGLWGERVWDWGQVGWEIR